MKRILVLLLAVVLLASFASCSKKEENANTDNSDSSQTDNISLSSTPDESSSSVIDESKGETNEKCAFCLDMEGHDRKCDTCGYWIHEKGEVWTKEVPENLKVTLVDYRVNYKVIEKIGDAIYIKEYLNEDDYKNGGNYYETFVTLTVQKNRDHYNNVDTEWRDNGFATKFGDVYEMFAVEVLQNLTGTSLSSTVEKCLDAASVGTETVAGKECTVKEYEGNFGTKYKVWMYNNIPLKTAQMDTNTETEYKTMYEIFEWDTSITEFSAEMPQ